ncbi:uncharacterized protein LOC130677815 [Microplitis mediator]|uniref:uncharacterized protein LOC130677815 n=1 Tax=Microplitis mediator TaxID=375433 RepID=UPI0025562CF8|nr:uncharacterized protein LOC130677815 [Microplitis mediator]
MFKIISLLFLFLGTEKITAIDLPIVSDIQDIISLGHDLSDLASGNVPLITSLFGGNTVDPTIAKLDGLSTQIEELTKLFNVKMDAALSQILNNVPRDTDFRTRMGQLHKYITRINGQFDDYRRLLKSASKYNQYSINQFIQATTSSQDGDLPEILNQIHRLFITQQSGDIQGGLLDLAVPIFKDMKPGSLCGITKSRQQRVYDIYRTVMFTELKGFIMSSYSYGLLSIYHNSSFEEEAKRSEERLIKSAYDYMSATKEALKVIPREIIVCDPPKHILGETFTELIRTVQMTMLHEYMLSSDGSCGGSCSDFNTNKIYRKYEDFKKKTWYPENPCQGRIDECRDLNYVEFCEVPGKFKERLVYVDNYDDRTYGDQKLCTFGKESALWKLMIGVYRCHPCLCQCIEDKAESTAHRAISFLSQRTDVDKNMVLTGIRFIKKNHVLHLQIEQGKLIEDGRIENGTIEWVPLDELKYDAEAEGGAFVKVVGGKEIPMKKTVDYAFIHHELRHFLLDNVVAPRPDFVVTGARLRLGVYSAQDFHLEVRFSKFNFTTGSLISFGRNDSINGNLDFNNNKIPSRWYTTDLDRHYGSRHSLFRKVVDVKDKLDPSKSYNNVLDSEGNSRIMLTHSSVTADVGQSTIPYFDIQPVAPEPRVALDGIGLYHRSNGESGGFLSLKLFTHDISTYLNPVIKSGELSTEEIKDIKEESEFSELA